MSAIALQKKTESEAKSVLASANIDDARLAFFAPPATEQRAIRSGPPAYLAFPVVPSKETNPAFRNPCVVWSNRGHEL